MIKSFRDNRARALFEGRRGDKKWASFEKVARRKLVVVDAAHNLSDLKVPPNNRLEALNYDRVGQHSIRVNDQYRVCFVWEDGHAYQVEIVNFHQEV